MPTPAGIWPCAVALAAGASLRPRTLQEVLASLQADRGTAGAISKAAPRGHWAAADVRDAEGYMPHGGVHHRRRRSADDDGGAC
jgi:hypothetical protein